MLHRTFLPSVHLLGLAKHFQKIDLPDLLLSLLLGIETRVSLDAANFSCRFATRNQTCVLLQCVLPHCTHPVHPIQLLSSYKRWQESSKEKANQHHPWLPCSAFKRKETKGLSLPTKCWWLDHVMAAVDPLWIGRVAPPEHAHCLQLRRDNLLDQNTQRISSFDGQFQ